MCGVYVYMRRTRKTLHAKYVLGKINTKAIDQKSEQTHTHWETLCIIHNKECRASPRKLCVQRAPYINQLTNVRAAQVYPLFRVLKYILFRVIENVYRAADLDTSASGHYLRGCCSHRHNSILRCLPWRWGYSAKVKHKHHIFIITIGRVVILSRVYYDDDGRAINLSCRLKLLLINETWRPSGGVIKSKA